MFKPAPGSDLLINSSLVRTPRGWLYLHLLDRLVCAHFVNDLTKMNSLSIALQFYANILFFFAASCQL